MLNFSSSFTDVFADEIADSQESQPMSISPEFSLINDNVVHKTDYSVLHRNEAHFTRPAKGTGQNGQFRSVDEIGKIVELKTSIRYLV